MDDDLRAAERAWCAAPDDPLAHERWIEARFRAGIAVDHEELDARLHPARKFVLPVPALLHLELPEGGEWSAEAAPGQPVSVPAGRRLSVIPSSYTIDSVKGLTGGWIRLPRSRR